MRYNWNWGILWETSADGHNTWIMTLFHGLGWTLAAAACAWVIALLLGSVIGVMRTTPSKWAQRIGNAWVELFRNIPLLVQLFLWYFVLPEVLPKGMGDSLKQMAPPWGSFVPAVIGLGLFTSARVAEQVRAGIQALPRGQVSAGYALGLDYWQTMAKIVLPQAFRNMIPILLTQTIILFQDTSLVYVLSITDFLGAASKVAQRDGRLVEMYLFAALVYFVISFGLSVVVKRLQQKIAIVR